MVRYRPALAALLLAAVLAGAPAGAATSGTAGPSAAAPTAIATPEAPGMAPAAEAATRADGAGRVSSSGPAARPVVTRANTTATLELDGPTERATFGSASLDVAGAMAVGGAEVRGRFARLRVEHRYDAAETAADRRAAVRAATDRLDARVTTLRGRELAAREAFADGTVSRRAYLRQLAMVGVAAEELDEATTVLARRADEAGAGRVTTEEVAAIRADLVGLQGPVRARLAQGAAGTAGTVRVFVETDGDGLTLATTVSVRSDGQYVRSAHVPGARNETLPDQFEATGHPIDATRARARELYPWTFENNAGISVGLLAGGLMLRDAGVYPATVNHPHGTVRRGDLVAYLDGGTTDAFREVQYLSAGAVPNRTLGRDEAGQLSLSVNVTRAGGPMHVRTTDTAGDPVDARLHVNGDTVGTAGADGSRWLVAPRGSVNVTAVEGGSRATVSGTV